ncbi:hypothetical protein [Vannielia sp.]|uniref:hypothetical protein n=1 Tax=Vannielia sp. TaxID=2813045 RepID=UPI0026250FD8|nr:hypothetical protein [Vannielia sp.]MDF1871442.1 hypothetical protein [Vannielia sp.]
MADWRLWGATLLAYASGAGVAWATFMILGAYYWGDGVNDLMVASWLVAGGVLGFLVFAVMGQSLAGRFGARLNWWLMGLIATIVATVMLAALVMQGIVTLIQGLVVVGLPFFVLAGYGLGQLEKKVGA